MTMCVADCCGLDAFDINPIHVASYLLMHRGAADPREVEQIRAQLDSLQANYGAEGASGRGATFHDLNQGLSGPEVDAFAARVRSALERALSLLADPRVEDDRPSPSGD